MIKSVSAFLLALALSAQASAQSVRPNVVLIVTDDVGYGDIGSYGAPDIKMLTPVVAGDPAKGQLRP